MSDTPQYDQMTDKIAECHRIDEVLEIREANKAQQAYKHQVAHNFESEQRVKQIGVRAERRIGELIIEAEQAGTFRGGRGGDRKSSTAKELDSLASFGVSKKQALLYRQVAKVPQEKFEQYMRGGATSVYTIARREAEKEYVMEQCDEAGMPEFDQPDKRPHRTIHVHFEDEDAVAEFAGLVGQKITPETRFIHFPEIENTSCTDREWVGAPSAEATA